MPLKDECPACGNLVNHSWNCPLLRVELEEQQRNADIVDLTVIKAQRFLAWGIFLGVVGIAGVLFLDGVVGGIASFAWLAGTLCSLVAVVAAARRIWDTPTAIFMGVGSMIPIVGLAIVLKVNAAAVAYIRRSGREVGIFGARG